ncbi:hypothetical protein HZB02_00330 [Candidatus Woesearchaeota archaeon]|nr:hypothetical protein [Candidatus Woesearchaeota archaeon]
MDNDLTLVIEKLDKIEEDITYLKQHMVDKNSLLSDGEQDLVEQGLREYHHGKTVSLEQIKKKRR